MMELKVRTRKAQGTARPDETRVQWDPARTALIVCDMWDTHTCRSAADRVNEMAAHMNHALKAARRKGILILHAPSDCMDYYKDTPQRKRAQAAPMVKAPVTFQWNYYNPECEGEIPEMVAKGGCSCDTAEPCNNASGPPYPWTRENAAIEIADEDAVSQDGQEVFNLFEQRGIANVIMMGVHTNCCVLGRPFGIRQMVYLKKNIVLCRDLTDSVQRSPGRHFEGLELIIEHIEQYWCGTISSNHITGGKPFRFKGRK